MNRRGNAEMDGTVTRHHRLSWISQWAVSGSSGWMDSEIGVIRSAPQQAWKSRLTHQYSTTAHSHAPRLLRALSWVFKWAIWQSNWIEISIAGAQGIDCSCASWRSNSVHSQRMCENQMVNLRAKGNHLIFAGAMSELLVAAWITIFYIQIWDLHSIKTGSRGELSTPSETRERHIVRRAKAVETHWRA